VTGAEGAETEAAEVDLTIHTLAWFHREETCMQTFYFLIVDCAARCSLLLSSNKLVSNKLSAVYERNRE